MQQDETAVAAAMAVLDRFIAAFSNRDTEGIRASFNFPHVRFASGTVKVFATPADYSFENFASRPEAKEWARSTWLKRDVLHAGPDKVHFDTEFARWRADGSLIASFRSIYIVTRVSGRWGIQGRSSFAP